MTLPDLEPAVLFGTVLEHMPSATAVVDEAGRVIAINAAFGTMFDYAREELVGQPVELLVPERFRDVHMGHRAAYTAAPHRRPMGTGRKLVGRRRDGSEFPLDISFSPLRSDGDLLVMCVVRDISDRERAEEAPVEDETPLRLVIEQVQAAFWWTDSELRLVSRLGSPLPFGDLRPDQLMGTSLFDYPQLDDPDAVATAHSRALAGEPSDFEHTRGERVFWGRVEPLRGPDGAVVGTIGVARDITMEKLRESERRFRSLLENSSDIIVVIDRERLIRYASPSIERVLGYDPEALIGLDGFELIHPDERPGVAEDFARVVDNPGERALIEFRARGKDGSDHDFAGIATNALGDPAVSGIVLNALDVTERKRSDEVLRQTEERFRLIGQNVRDLMAVVSPEGRYVYVSPSHEAVLGYSADTLLAMGPLDLVHPDDVAWLSGWHSAEPFEFRARKADGTWAWLEGSSYAVTGEGRPYVVSVARDISERKRAEEQRERLEAQLRQAQKMEAVGRLAGGIAHDFNNILTVVTGYSELILSRFGKEAPFSHEIEAIREAAERASSLTRQLLAFGRRQRLQARVLDLNAVIADTGEMLRRLIGENIELFISLDPELGRVRCDPGQLEQVIINLAVNARDAMPDGGRLRFETANAELDESYGRRHSISFEPGRYVVLLVSDTGAGIDAETQSHIFEPFFTTKGAGKGTGLGLSTVYGIVKQSGGYIWVYSEPGRGTTFRVYLPRVEAKADARERPRSRSGALGGSETVLVAEDDEAIRSLIREILQDSGYTVLEARRGDEACELGETYQGPIDLLLTDVVMPAMSGLDLSARLLDLRPSMKTLYMSGYSEQAIADQDDSSEMAAFLEKPFDSTILVTRVRELLDAQSRRARTP